MKVISIGPDKDLLKAGSVSFERHALYAEKMEELHAVIFARRSFGKEIVQIAKNAWAYPTYARTIFGLFWNAFLLGRRIIRTVKKRNFLVLSAQDPFESGIVAFALSRLYHVPLLIQEHGDFFSGSYWRRESFFNRVRYPLGLFLLRRADHVRVVSGRIKNTLIAKGVSAERITVAPVYTDTALFRQAEPDITLRALKKAGVPLVLSMARFVPQKNLSLLVRACLHAHVEGVPLHLVLMGRGAEEKKLRNLMSSSSLKEGANKGFSVSFVPWTNSPAGALKSADIYALSSNYEGWGRVCIEALASGVPLVTTDVGCVGDVVFHEKNALVSPVEDENAFTKNLTRLARDKALCTRLVERGKWTIAHLSTKEQSVEAYIACLERCTRSEK